MIKLLKQVTENIMVVDVNGDVFYMDNNRNLYDFPHTSEEDIVKIVASMFNSTGNINCHNLINSHCCKHSNHLDGCFGVEESNYLRNVNWEVGEYDEEVHKTWVK